MRKSPGKGLGIFAIADIPSGTRIIAEAALLKIDRNNGDARNILYAFENLSASQQGSYLELHGFACAAFRRAAEQEMGRSWQRMPEKCMNLRRKMETKQVGLALSQKRLCLKSTATTVTQETYYTHLKVFPPPNRVRT
ncbi:hypothetical protein DM02DRAFT_663967 [Periconia macrospinosa]|uniref:SET domain-containing protein n=1 Tax=Periconia macrospinosa TaxID=97972 RepID=A0A2V1D2I1_9PLEO|nr:hypothetical protein DM02DRAFT_663967 [Periconia macrospinosa]